jgi:hypothetical protein
MNTPLTPAVLDERDAATYVGMSCAFLRRARMTGRTRSGSTGPDYVRIPGGRGIRYRVADLDAWLAANVHGATAGVS